MKVILHHWDQNAHGIVRFGEVEVVAVYDEREKLNGTDTGEYLGNGKNGLKITNEIDVALEKDAEIMITTGEGLYFTNPEKIKDWEKNVKKALEKGLKVYNMSKIMYGKETIKFKVLAKKYKTEFIEASQPDYFKELEKFIPAFYKEGLKTRKRVSFVGSSMNSGKITAMFMLKRKIKDKVKVGVIGTEPSSIFMGADEQVIPEVISTMRGAQTITLALKKNEIEKNPDIQFIGGQTGLIASTQDIKEARAGAVVAWQILFGSVPTDIILCSKAKNENNIKDHISLIKTAFPKVNILGIVINGRRIEKNEITKIVNKIEKETGILTLDIMVMPDKMDKLVEKIIS